MEKELNKILSWAKDKIHSGNEPPWAWYQYMKLIETVETIQQSMASTNPIATVTTENSQQLAKQKGNVLRLKVPKRQKDTSQFHQGTKKKVLLPM